MFERRRQPAEHPVADRPPGGLPGGYKRPLRADAAVEPIHRIAFDPAGHALWAAQGSLEVAAVVSRPPGAPVCGTLTRIKWCCTVSIDHVAEVRVRSWFYCLTRTNRGCHARGIDKCVIPAVVAVVAGHCVTTGIVARGRARSTVGRAGAAGLGAGANPITADRVTRHIIRSRRTLQRDWTPHELFCVSSRRAGLFVHTKATRAEQQHHDRDTAQQRRS